MEWLEIFRKKNDPEQKAIQETIALLNAIKNIKQEIKDLIAEPKGLNAPGFKDATVSKILDQKLLETKIVELINLEKEVYRTATGDGTDPGRLIDREFAEYLTKSQTEDDRVLFEVRRNILMKSDPALEERPMNSLFIPQKK